MKFVNCLSIIILFSASAVQANYLNVSAQNETVCYIANSHTISCFDSQGSTFHITDSTREFLAVAQLRLWDKKYVTCFYEKASAAKNKFSCVGFQPEAKDFNYEVDSKWPVQVVAGKGLSLCRAEEGTANCGSLYFPPGTAYSAELKYMKTWIQSGGQPLMTASMIFSDGVFCHPYYSKIKCFSFENRSYSDRNGVHWRFEPVYEQTSIFFEELNPSLVTSFATFRSGKIGASDEAKNLHEYERYCLIQEGILKCDGADYYEKRNGYLAPQLFFDKTSPYMKKMPRLVSASQVSIAYDHICVSDVEGVKCWGPQKSFVVKDFSGPFQISSGKDFTCAIDASKLKCWNSKGKTTKEIKF